MIACFALGRKIFSSKTRHNSLRRHVHEGKWSDPGVGLMTRRNEQKANGTSELRMANRDFCGNCRWGWETSSREEVGLGRSWLENVWVKGRSANNAGHVRFRKLGDEAVGDLAQVWRRPDHPHLLSLITRRFRWRAVTASCGKRQRIPRVRPGRSDL